MLVVMSMTTCEWRRAYSHTQPVEYKISWTQLPVVTHPTTHIPSIMISYDANYNPSADPAFDEAPFTEGENAVEDQAAEVVDADSSVEITVQEDRNAERTNSHGQPSKCTRIPMTYSDETLTNERLLQSRLSLC
jgi:hypothetical protein